MPPNSTEQQVRQYKQALAARLREHANGIDLIAHGTTVEGEDMRAAAALIDGWASYG